MKTYLLVFGIAIVAFHSTISAQEFDDSEFILEVYKVYPYLTINKAQLMDASKISDLNDLISHNNLAYDPNWVAEYLHLETTTYHKGTMHTTSSQNDLLTSTQKKRMLSADRGTAINIRIQYLPSNMLSSNEVKELSFDLLVDVDADALYHEGPEGLEAFLGEHMAKLLTSYKLNEHKVAMVKFIINEEGHIINPQIHNAIYNPDQEEGLPASLLNIVNEMSQWQPASYADGTQVSQDYVLVLGDPKSCMMNLIRTKAQYLPEEDQ